MTSSTGHRHRTSFGCPDTHCSRLVPPTRPGHPTSTWTTSTERAAFAQARIRLGTGAAVLRDYTKSMKHHWHDVTFIPDLTDPTTACLV
ncbi:hypothetical protein [Micromonospora ureilytica]|uniref:hypothetical protein n=1 Tax=Micromonospora ureilytica TaxID=709868 RepID=UPI002E1310D2|nr:ATP-grasp domain-containing protein [Micromonospora ureilytica]